MSNEINGVTPHDSTVKKYKITIVKTAGTGERPMPAKGDHPMVKSRGRVFFVYSTSMLEAIERFKREGITAFSGLPAVPPNMMHGDDFDIALATDEDEKVVVVENYKNGVKGA